MGIPAYFGCKVGLIKGLFGLMKFSYLLTEIGKKATFSFSKSITSFGSTRKKKVV